MSQVYFKPWIGNNYEMNELFGKKILVLGESHYSWDFNIQVDHELTKKCINDQIKGSYSKQFWTNIVIALTGTKPTLEEKRIFWHSVAFYNYVQEPVGKGPRLSPKEEMWGKSIPAFVDILNELQPQFILALGYRLWWRLPDLNRKAGPIIFDKKNLQTWFYPLRDYNCLAYGVNHPSAGFSGKYWHSHIQNALQLA